MASSIGRLLRRAGIVVLSLAILALGAALATVPLGDEYPPAAMTDPSRHKVVAVFGATGLVGEGVFEALRRDPDVRMVRQRLPRASPSPFGTAVSAFPSAHSPCVSRP